MIKNVHFNVDIYKPYLDGCHLREDAPIEVVEADKELHKIAWDMDRMQ